MGPSAPTGNRYITAAEAADRLGIKPWEVVRLVQSGEVAGLVLVDSAALDALAEEKK